MQIVEVSVRPGSQWAYRWDGDEPLKVGDQVVVPAAARTYMAEHIEWVGPVMALGSTYTGPLRSIIRKEEKP